MNQGLIKLLEAHFKWERDSLIDARGLLVYSLVHCQGSQDERQAALIQACGKIREWSCDHSKARVFHYEDFLRMIICFAMKGDLELCDKTSKLENDEH